MTRLAWTTVLYGLLIANFLMMAACQTQQEALRQKPEILSVIDHDETAFTQGFLLYEGRLFESTGLYGESSLRELNPATGEVLRAKNIDDAFFAEGLERVGNKLIQLTWRAGKAFVYDLETFVQLETFAYEGEGWGLCHDGEALVMSDGSPTLFFRDAKTFELISQLEVTFQDKLVRNLNELECALDHVYANIWQTSFIVKIDKTTGLVTSVIDASNLLNTVLSPAEIDALVKRGGVLNGIAYNAEAESFLITGKLWPKMFEVRFIPDN